MAEGTSPYELFMYALSSPVSRERYSTRLSRFLNWLTIEGPIEDQYRALSERGRKDPEWLTAKMIRLCLLHSKFMI